MKFSTLAFFKKYVQELLIIIISIILLGFFLGEITGIHYDEAFVIDQSRQIAAGIRPLCGMTPYTGSFHQYLLVPFFWAFGFDVFVLRVTSLFFNISALVLIMYLIKCLHPETAINRIAGILFCTAPPFIMISRYAGEVQCLNAFLTSLSLVLFYHSLRSKKVLSAVLAMLGGLSLGILTYNHIIGLIVPISLIITTSVVYGISRLKTITPLYGGIGFLSGISVWIYQLIFGDLMKSWVEKASTGSLSDLLTDIPNLPNILNLILNGSLLYNLFVGKVQYYVAPYITVVLFLFITFRIIFRKQLKFSKPEYFLSLFILLLILLTMFVVPNFTPHYFILPLYSVPILIALLAGPLITYKQNLIKNITYGLLGTVVISNIFYLTTNYFISYKKTGGNLCILNIGSRVTTTSNAWIRTDKLLEQLKEKEVKTVFSHLSIYAPLYILDKNRYILKFADDTQIPRNLSEIKNVVAVIFYNGINLVRKKQYTPPDSHQVQYGNIIYEADYTFDEHFKVFLAKPN